MQWPSQFSHEHEGITQNTCNCLCDGRKTFQIIVRFGMLWRYLCNSIAVFITLCFNLTVYQMTSLCSASLVEAAVYDFMALNTRLTTLDHSAINRLLSWKASKLSKDSPCGRFEFDWGILVQSNISLAQLRVCPQGGNMLFLDLCQ